MYLIGLIGFALLISGCITRTEVEQYTITMIDTTADVVVTMAPDRRDRGIVYPSSRRVRYHRRVVQYDSVVKHYYPDFIRLGLFESAGLLGTKRPSRYSLSSGLFGLYGLLDPDTSGLFSGGLYRFGVGEWRLRWFRDAPNWTIGTYAMEILVLNIIENREDYVVGMFPLYIRKRFFLREEIPYVAVTPTLGISIFPAAYINIGGTVDVGSIGGVNLRAYLGYWYGLARGELPIITLRGMDMYPVSTFYAGIGISLLDFLNRVEETFIEWKDHPHSAWNVGFAHLGFFYRGVDTTGALNPPGVLFTLLPVQLAIPITPQNFHITIGTSLLRIARLDPNLGAIALLPIRFGYWYTLIPDELSVSPFVEYGYLPSSFVDLGISLNLYINQYTNVRLIAGFMQGQILNPQVYDFLDNLPIDPFHRWYFGITLGLGDRIFFDHQLRYARKRDEH